jgi:hypothetical protein
MLPPVNIVRMEPDGNISGRRAVHGLATMSCPRASAHWDTHTWPDLGCA